MTRMKPGSSVSKLLNPACSADQPNGLTQARKKTGGYTKKPRLSLCATGLMIVLGLTPCSALTEDEEEDPFLPEVVVTATRKEEEIQKVPANVTVITEEDIENSNARNVVDLLRSQEGVVVRDLLGNGKSAQVDLRGFGEAGPYNTLVLVDGRRVNEIDLSGVDWTQIPLDQVQRIEILRGTGSVLYGDNAVGGVINILTKTPSEQLTARLSSVFGTYRRTRQEASVTGGHANLAASIFASYDATDGYRDNNEFTTRDFGGKVLFDATEFLSLNLTGSIHSDDFGLPGTLTEQEIDSDRRATNTPGDDGETKDGYLKLGFDADLGTYGTLVTDLSYRDRESDSQFPDPLFPFAIEYKTDTRAIAPRYAWNGEISGHLNTLIAGMDLYWSELDSKTFSGFFAPVAQLSGLADIDRDSFGLYLNNEFSLLDNLILSIGARRERVRYGLSQRDLSAFPLAPLDETLTERESAYSAGLTYLYHGDSSFFVRANRSFRFPLTDEIIVFDYPAGRIRVNSDLKPQTGHHYETGVRHYVTPAIQTGLTLFWAEIKDEIFFNPAPIFSNENHPETLHRGLEIGAKAHLCKNLTVFGNHTYEKATFEKEPFKNNDIPAVPRHKTNLGFQIHDLVPGLALSANYNHVSSSYAISDQANRFEKLERYYTLNARLSYQWRWIQAFVGVNNITDLEYSEYAVIGGTPTGLNFYPASERNWVAGLEAVF